MPNTQVDIFMGTPDLEKLVAALLPGRTSLPQAVGQSPAWAWTQPSTGRPRQLGAQEAAGDDGEVLELGGGGGGLQDPELETQLGPGAEHQLGSLQAEHLLPPARVLLADEEEKVALGHQLLHCLAASYSTADLYSSGQKEFFFFFEGLPIKYKDQKMSTIM